MRLVLLELVVLINIVIVLSNVRIRSIVLLLYIITNL
jgi:hypothetical protein